MKLIFASLFVLVQINFSFQAKNWEYSLETLYCNSSHPDVFDIKLRPKRVERGKYGLSGSVTINEELDNSLMVEIKTYRSERGNSDYKLLPFRVPPTKFYKFMTDVYLKLGIMESAKSCSNLVQTDSKVWDKPYPTGDYVLKDCFVSTDPFPDHMQPGYYKLAMTVQNEKYSVFAEGVLKIDQKLSSF